MYLVAIHVPVFVDGDAISVSTDWGRSLQLLRDSLQGRYGRLCVVAPTLPAVGFGDQLATPAAELGDDIDFVGVFDLRCRARHYWMTERKRWLGVVREQAARAQVAHTGMSDLYRPINLDALRVAVASPAPVVFTRDTDEVQKALDLSRDAPFLNKAKTRLYNAAYDRAMRWAVAHADLSMLKGQGLMRRYGRFAKNAQCHHDTSHSVQSVVSEPVLDERIASLEQGRPLRLVYCGRFEPRKGVDHGIRSVAEAVRQGAQLSFDLIGGGQQQAELEALVGELGVEQHVRFVGKMPYGPELLSKLSTYDGLWFTPLGEDTPRMIFDGYAAGLPLLGYSIAYTSERAEEEGAAALSPLGDISKAAQLLLELTKDRARLAGLARRARQAGVYHAAESWYARRAQWTFDMVDAYRASSR